jgi:hypothetical protein
MPSTSKTSFTPRALSHEPAPPPASDGAKLLVPTWPQGLRGSGFRLASHAGRVAGWCLGVLEQTVKGESVTDAAGESPAQRRLAGRLDSARWPTSPLRVGLRVGHELSRRIKEAPGSGGVRFVFVASETGDRDACRSLDLDAMLVALPAGMKILTREHRQREAAWFDWGSTRPLSYPAVFPTRLDCGQVTVDESPAGDVEVHLLRAILEAAAVSSRASARLVLADRWGGRKAVDEGGVLDDAMSRLAGVFQQASLGQVRSAHRAAARVLSAWALADRPGGFSPRQRQLAELCARCAGNEAEVMLRLGAARLADLDDAGGRQALLAADRMLRDRPTLPGVDNEAFVQAELDQGRHDPLAVGRVAAGIVLACAAMPVEKLVFTQGDLLDEMRFSAWLVGRDQDRTLVHCLTRELVSQRRAEQLGLPPAPEAAAAERAEPIRKPTTRGKTAAKSRKSTGAKPRSRARSGQKASATQPGAAPRAKPKASRARKSVQADAIKLTEQTKPATTRRRKAA